MTTNNCLFPEWEPKYLINDKESIFKDGSTNVSDHIERIKKFNNLHLLSGIEREGLMGMPKAQPVYVKKCRSVLFLLIC